MIYRMNWLLVSTRRDWATAYQVMVSVTSQARLHNSPLHWPFIYVITYVSFILYVAHKWQVYLASGWAVDLTIGYDILYRSLFTFHQQLKKISKCIAVSEKKIWLLNVRFNIFDLRILMPCPIAQWLTLYWLYKFIQLKN